MNVHQIHKDQKTSFFMFGCKVADEVGAMQVQCDVISCYATMPGIWWEVYVDISTIGFIFSNYFSATSFFWFVKLVHMLHFDPMQHAC